MAPDATSTSKHTSGQWGMGRWPATANGLQRPVLPDPCRKCRPGGLDVGGMWQSELVGSLSDGWTSGPYNRHELEED